MSAAARVRFNNAGGVPELNYGCYLTVEPGATSVGHFSRSNARSVSSQAYSYYYILISI